MSEDRSGLLWVPNPTGSHESFWMGIQRFMYLNDLSGEEFLHLQYRLYDPATRPTDSALSRHIETCYPVNEGLLPLGYLERLDNNSLPFASGHRHTCFNSDTPVRFCAECLVHCHHSLLFQFPAVARCPYHEVELQQTCPKCGGALSSLGFIPAKHPKPFCCTSCGNSFVSEKKLAQRVLFGLPDARNILDAAYKRMYTVACADITSFSGMSNHDNSEDRFARFHCHALHAAATRGAPKPSWWTGLEDPVSYRPIRLPKVPLSSESQTGDERPFLTDYLHPMLSILKSINRHFSRLIRTVCRHRSPREMYCEIDRSSIAISPHFLRLDQGDCPCCAVLSWWRANWGYYLALHQAATMYRYPPPWTATRSWIYADVPKSTTQLAQAAWDSFMSLSVQMLYRVTPKTERLVPVCRSLVNDSSHRGFASRRNISVEVQRSQPHMGTAALLDLDQPKVGDGTLVCKDAVGKPCTVSYSLCNAKQALAELHTLRQSGPLIAIRPRSFQHQGDDFFDIWYRGSWLRREQRNWSHDFIAASHVLRE